MERKRMMETTTKRQSQWWWLDNNTNSNVGRSQWLQSTLSALDDKTKAMLRIIEEDADSFSQRAEMYYKKRPQLVGLVEDFYRAHRSLAEQFDHLKHDPGTRRTSPLARSFCFSNSPPEKAIDPRKSYDCCFTKLARDSDDLFLSPLSKGSPEKPLDRLKPFGGRYTDLAYESSDESIDSEVDDPMPEESFADVDDFGEELSSAEMNHVDIMAKIDRLDEESMIQMKQLMAKEKAIEELKLKLSKSATEVMELKEEVEKLRLENVEMYLLKMKDAEESENLSMNLKKEKEQLIAENATLNNQFLQKDEEKREAIRQLSVAIDMLKGENRLLKKALANKRWNPFESQVLKGFGKLFNCSIISSQPSVVPL